MPNPFRFRYVFVIAAVMLIIGIAGFSMSASSQGNDSIFDNDTASQIETFYAQNGGRAAFSQKTQDVIAAFLYAEDAVAAGDFATARSYIDGYNEQYQQEWQSGFSAPPGLNIGRPHGHYGMLMLDEITRQGAAHPNQTSQPLTLTIVTVECAEGVQPTKRDLTETQPVSHTLKPAITENDHYVMRQGAQLFQQYISAITDRQRHVQLHFYSEQDTCATVTSPAPPNGLWIGPSNTSAIIRDLPDHVKNASDMYWFVYPSNIPETDEFAGFEFVSGATGRFDGRMVFMMDDRWILKKPLHLGTGVTSEVERRMYHPQWMQHEYFHHLFLGEFPEFRLEESSHQWFWPENWPEDFVSPSGEAVYYSEALNRRFYGASPSITQRLSHSNFADTPVRFYTGASYSGTAFGVQAGEVDIGILMDSPVGNDAISSIEIADGYDVEICTGAGGTGACQNLTESTTQLTSPFDDQVSYVDVHYGKPSSVVGSYLRHPVTNDWHHVTVSRQADGYVWTNEAGISCGLTWNNGSLIGDTACHPSLAAKEISIEFGGSGAPSALVLSGETFQRRIDAAGYFERRPILNNWHRVHIVQDDLTFTWTNEANVSCVFTWTGTTATGDPGCSNTFASKLITPILDSSGALLGLISNNEVYHRVPVLGYYERTPVTNDWHRVQIVREENELVWTNAAGIRCGLERIDGGLVGGSSCHPSLAGKQVATTLDEYGKVAAVTLNGEAYLSYPDVLGYFERLPITNTWHSVEIIRDGGELWWTNAAGVRCPLTRTGNTLVGGASCPASFVGQEISIAVDPNGQVAGVIRNGEWYEFRYGGNDFVISSSSSELIGDANCSLAVDLADALTIAQHVQGTRTSVAGCPLASPTSEINGTAADVNQDGNVGADDAMMIMGCEIGLDNAFCPAE